MLAHKPAPTVSLDVSIHAMVPATRILNTATTTQKCVTMVNPFVMFKATTISYRFQLVLHVTIRLNMCVLIAHSVIHKMHAGQSVLLSIMQSAQTIEQSVLATTIGTIIRMQTDT